MATMLWSTGADGRSTFGPMNETSQPVELLLSVDRDGPATLGAQIEEERPPRDPRRRPAAGRAGPVDPRPRAPARRLAPGRRRRLRAARGRGLAPAAPGRPPARVRRRRRRPTPPTPARRRRRPARRASTSGPSAPDVSTFPRAAWLRALRDALGVDDRRRPRLRRPARRRRAPRRAGELPRPRPRRRRRPRAHPRHVRLLPGPRPRLPRARGARRDAGSRSRTRATPSRRRSPRRAGLEPVAVAVDEEGLRVDALAATGADAVVLTPAHQDPTGVVLSGERRTALVAWLREHDAVAIEDDYDAEYRYDRAAVGALQGLDADRVVYLGSASKTLAPALRLGWMVLAGGARRGRQRGEGAGRPRHEPDRPARVRRLPRARRARPPPAADADPVPRAPRRARRRARRGAARGDRPGRRGRAARDRRACPTAIDEAAVRAEAQRRRIALSTIGANRIGDGPAAADAPARLRAAARGGDRARGPRARGRRCAQSPRLPGALVVRAAFKPDRVRGRARSRGRSVLERCSGCRPRLRERRPAPVGLDDDARSPALRGRAASVQPPRPAPRGRGGEPGVLRRRRPGRRPRRGARTPASALRRAGAKRRATAAHPRSVAGSSAEARIAASR